MRKSEVLPGLHGRCDFAFVHARRKFVGNQNHHNLGLFRGLPHGQYAQPGLLRLRDGSTCVLQTHNDVAARIRQIHGMRVPLRPKSDHGNFSVLDVF